MTEETQERTLGQLVADASRELSELVRYEIALAKVELGRSVQRGAAAGGLFAAAIYLVSLAVILITIAAAFGLVEAGLPPWAALLIVAGVELLIALVLALIGRSRISRMRPPERTIRTTRESLESLRRAARDGTREP